MALSHLLENCVCSSHHVLHYNSDHLTTQISERASELQKLNHLSSHVSTKSQTKIRLNFARGMKLVVCLLHADSTTFPRILQHVVGLNTHYGHYSQALKKIVINFVSNLLLPPLPTILPTIKPTHKEHILCCHQSQIKMIFG